MKSFALLVLAIVTLGGSIGHAAPATQPTLKAAERARAIKEAVKSFRLDLYHHGEQDKPYYHLTLSVAPVRVTVTSPFHLMAVITEAQAEQVIDHLAVEGFLDQAIDAANKKLRAPTTPSYTLSVWSGTPPQRLELHGELGWGLPMLKRLDGLRAVLEGDAARKMDLLLGRLSGHRRQWEAAAPATQPSAEMPMPADATAKSVHNENTKPVSASAFDLQCKKADDAITVMAGAGKTILDITSRSGIGGATIERKAEHWPDPVVLRLRLHGLESLAISAGNMKLAASHPNRLSLWKGNEEGPAVTKDSPYWMDIRAVDADGKPAKGLPGEGGWFEMTIPKAMLTDQTKTITLGWIDFYR